MYRPAYRLIDKSDVTRTRPTLERAGWRCERCKRSDDLRVVDESGKLSVVCDLCRVRSAPLGTPW